MLSPTSSPVDNKETAPFDLGFEWPEILYGWQTEAKEWLCGARPDQWLAVVSESIQGLHAYVARLPKYIDGVFVWSGMATPVDYSWITVKGMILLDDNGREIARRYLR